VSLLHSSSPFSSPADLPQGDRPRRRACRRCARPASGSEGERRSGGGAGRGRCWERTAREKGREERVHVNGRFFAESAGASCGRFSHVVGDNACVSACVRARARVLNRDADPTGAYRPALPFTARSAERRNRGNRGFPCRRSIGGTLSAALYQWDADLIARASNVGSANNLSTGAVADPCDSSRVAGIFGTWEGRHGRRT